MYYQPRAKRTKRISPFSILALLVPALLLSCIAEGTNVLPGDIGTMLFIQRHIPDETAWLFELVNWIGTTLIAAAVTVTFGLLFLVLRQPVAAVLTLLTFPLRLLNSVLKAIFDSPRPSEAVVRVTEIADGLGFPSGHAMGAMLMYGMLFILAPRLTASRPLQVAFRIAAMTTIIHAGVSRIYVGAHWPSDVLGGYLWGLITLLGAGMAVRFCLRQTRIGRSQG
jgi:undecaprenyl-diphosphatase